MMTWDGNGYPTEETLKEIESFNLGKRFEKVSDFIKLIQENWWAPDWGFEYHQDTGCLELHTAGWSGNENIIQAIKEQRWFWFYFWEKSTRGGHYWFKVFQFAEKSDNHIIPIESIKDKVE